MQIKSSFKDYYDYALSGITNDIDKSVVYSRLLDVVPYTKFTLRDNIKDSFANGCKTTSYSLNTYIAVFKLTFPASFLYMLTIGCDTPNLIAISVDLSFSSSHFSINS